jgi:hypothetical protein
LMENRRLAVERADGMQTGWWTVWWIFMVFPCSMQSLDAVALLYA